MPTYDSKRRFIH